MKKYLSLFGILVLCFSSFSQDWKIRKPIYKQIERSIRKKDSNLFYDSLMQRYLNADTTLSPDENRHLYFGFVFQPEYAPYAYSDYYDSLKPVLQNESQNIRDFRQIISYTDSILKKAPFDLRALNYQLYAWNQLENKAQFKNCMNQMMIIFDALLSSGNGLSKETSFYVIYTSHEYDLLNLLGFQYAGEQMLIEHYDYLKVTENPQGGEGFLF